MGSFIGLMLGLGIALLCWWVIEPQVNRNRPRRSRLRVILAEAGFPSAHPAILPAACLGMALLVGLISLLISHVWTIALVFGVVAAPLPWGYVQGRIRTRAREYAQMWPDAVDNLASAVRAGMSLTEALSQLAERGPEGLRKPFKSFCRDIEATGQFGPALDRLKVQLAEPIGDRVVEALRIARDVGGGDLGRMLRTLSTHLRHDLRTRSELESRQAWTINGARIAVAAPWAVLFFMSLQRDVISQYASGTGLLILSVGAAICLIAYRLMMWLGRLPTERRVLA